MKNVFKMIAIVMMMATVFSCEKVETPEMETKKDATITFTADFLGTKTSFTEGKLTWEAGDKIAVCDGTTVETVTLKAVDIKDDGASAEIKTATLKTDASEYYAIFPAACAYNEVDYTKLNTFIKEDGSIQISTGTTNRDKSQTFKSYAIASEAGGHFMFKNVDAIVYFKTDRTDIAKVEFKSNVSGMTKSNVLINPATEEITHSSYCEARTVEYKLNGDKEAYIPVSAGVTFVGGYTLTAYDSNGNILGTVSTSTDLSFENGKYYTIKNFDSRLQFPLSDAVLPGVFNISIGKHVQFSQGNLICDISGETPKWGFYENQYGYATGYSSTLISLFTWGYDPIESLYPGSIISNTINHLEGNYLPQDKDWGSQIGDGKTWRTLTGEEWKYLFETRTNAQDKYGYATVGGVYGIIILPDIFTDPMKNGGSGAFVPKTTTGWNANVYTTGGDWEAMEAAGAVFLPAAGSRSGSSLSYVGDYGFYWSSSHPTNSGPYGVTFDKSFINPYSSGDATTGKSVRLVTGSTTSDFAEATIDGKATYVKWIQLWEDGPKFAEYNVGVTDGKAESYGGLYTWADNIASAQWGDNWRMPTSDEFADLIKNCTFNEVTQDDVKCLICTGKGNYIDNSILLPYNGYNSPQFGNDYINSIGEYWSSTPSEQGGANFLMVGYHSDNIPFVKGCVLNYGLSVRAVLAE
ncbi:MAG: hypothetical protein MJZ06_07295 [Bacteroidaceae bacterium]|nr:hypothetical protein [Bacteroidaceae bacterium]